MDKATREKYACKVIEKSKMPAVMMKNEVSILKKAQHPNVIKFIDVFETPTKVRPPNSYTNKFSKYTTFLRCT